LAGELESCPPDPGYDGSFEQSLIDRAFEPGAYDDGGRPRTGLTLTKAVVEQHGGRFGIESEPGEGTYAQIRLPLRG
jgi:signal transduction histidine kinase